MSTSLSITASDPDPALLELPWHLPLEQWPPEWLALLPRGISRHIVRFVWLDPIARQHVVAIKETEAPIARREYELLRTLRTKGLPVVEPSAIVTGRLDESGQPLPACLVTRHLDFSLPYRALFSQSLREDTGTRLIDALAVLLVRLHIAGFYWGDVSLSNALFRRDAGAFAAYLVDAETGEIHTTLSPGQREYDLELATINIVGECMDLQAGGFLTEDFDPIQLATQLRERYAGLWHELTATERVDANARWRVQDRITRLNELGFDVGELSLATSDAGATLVIQPKVVDAGHHSRRLIRLTGLDVEENQARRLLNDLDGYVASLGQSGDEAILAHRWMTDCFEPVQSAVPASLRTKLDPAQLYHEVLDHRWFLSEQAGHDVGHQAAIDSYVRTVLPQKPDEWAVATDWAEEHEDWTMIGGGTSEMTAADYF